MYAIVDIETTGGNASTGAITEIAILVHNGVDVEGAYHTLVNPECPIPRYISSLTGITDEMVAEAPVFSEVAPHIFSLLSGKIFVAHNVNFDYSFIRHHLLKSGLSLDIPKLCTVRMSRKIFPGRVSYSLGNICRTLGIDLTDRHRAKGDATATAKLFAMLLENDHQQVIPQMLKRGSRESYLPMHLGVAEVDRLPHAPGVYYFHDKGMKVLYVGKARDLQRRVTSHFSNNSVSAKKQELLRNVHHISYALCGSEFMAIVMESLEIRRHWPPYNQSQKHVEFSYGLFRYEDQQGRIRLGIGRVKRYVQPLMKFPLMADGHRRLWKLVREYGLCPKCCYLQSGGDCEGVKEQYCGGVCEGREEIASYNARVTAALDSLQGERPSFALMESGRHAGEKTYLLMEEGRFYGYGFLPANQEISNREQLRSLLTPFPENEYLRSVVLRHAEEHPAKKMEWGNSRTP